MLKDKRYLLNTLKEIKNNRVTRLQPSFVSGVGFMYNDIGLENFEKQVEFLEYLEKMDIVQSKEGMPILRCNFCRKFKFSVRFNCIYCNSLNIESGSAIEHDICHNVDFEDKFLKIDGELKCDKCGKFLNAIGVDYSKTSIFKCKVCNGISSNVEQQYTCLTCGKILFNKEILISNLYDYSVNLGGISSLINDLEYIIPMIEELDRLGIKSVFPAVATGVSGTPHNFDLVAFDKYDKPILILETLESISELFDNRDNMVLSFIGKCSDFNISYKILVSLTELPRHLVNLLEINNISYMKIQNREESSLDIVQMISDIFNNTIEETTIQNGK